MDRIEIGFSNTRYIKAARKEHKCLCGALIPVGAPYERQVVLIDGEMRVYKEGIGCHSDCLDEDYEDVVFDDDFCMDDLPY